MDEMKTDDPGNASDAKAQERQRRRDLRRALAFGIIMATIQMAVLLYFMYR